MLDYGQRKTNILTHVATRCWRSALAVNAAAKADKSQERFYDALRELFVGAKVEGRFPAYRIQHAAYRGFRSDLDFPVSPVNLSVE